MSTVLIYNGVTIRNAQTIRFSQDVQYDESGTDALFHRFRITVEGTVHPGPPTSHRQISASDATASNSTASLVQIRQQLLQPRGELQYGHEVRQGGNNQGFRWLLQVLPIAGSNNTAAVDVNNGPKPQSADVTYVVGLQSYEVRFEIEASVVLCYKMPATTRLPRPTLGQSPLVLNNRWSLEDTIGADHFNTRTWNGTLRVRHAQWFPHGFRNMVAPPLLPNYKRVQQRYLQSEDGLTLRYTIVDRQREAAPPLPAIDWNAQEVVAWGTEATTSTRVLTVRVMGAPQGDRKRLLGAATNVIASRMRGLINIMSGDEAENVLLQSAQIVEQLHEPVIEVTAQIQVVGGTDADEDDESVIDRFLNLGTRPLGRGLEGLEGYNPELWARPEAYDSRNPAGMFNTYWQEPCDNVHGITGIAPPVSPEKTDGKEREDDNPKPVVYKANGEIQYDDVQARYRPEHRAKMYTHVTVENEYETSLGRLIMPYASSTYSEDQGATVAIVPSHAGVATRRFFVHLERAGAWPELPPFNSSFQDENGITYTALGSHIEPDAPALLPDGQTHKYVLRVTIDYMMSRPLRPGERIPISTSPIDATPIRQHQLTIPPPTTGSFLRA